MQVNLTSNVSNQSASAASASMSGTSSNGKTYDKKDLNKDGTVSAMEEAIYDMKHIAETETDSTTSTSSSNNIIDITA